jgi:hypothetical protein
MMGRGFGRNLIVAHQRVAFVLAMVCFVVPMSSVGAEAACESQRAAQDASLRRLQTTGATGRCDMMYVDARGQSPGLDRGMFSALHATASSPNIQGSLGCFAAGSVGSGM